MSVAVLQHTWPAQGDAWVLALAHVPQQNAFAASYGSGALSLWAVAPHHTPISTNRRAHQSSVNALCRTDEHTLASASTDGVKLWDARAGLGRSQAQWAAPKNTPVLSLGASAGGVVAAGCELAGGDAELHLWDLRQPAAVVRSFVDSHHDDITSVQFHGSRPYLMSGSTDGYVNVYNLAEPDEDEALHQTINYASVHSCRFSQDSRISVLSHMETLSFWELNSTDYEDDCEPRPRDLGDVRAAWANCEYVVDVYAASGFVAYGANSARSLTVMPFSASKEKFYADRAVDFPAAHGDDVVRDVLQVPGSTTLLTCGEDGTIKAWDAPLGKKKKSKKDRKDGARFKPY